MPSSPREPASAATIDRRWPADGKAPRTQAREDELVVLGARSLPFDARSKWVAARSERDDYSCSVDCDACWRSHLFSVGREAERIARFDAEFALSCDTEGS